jgi:putative sporulation protein YyaC
MNTFINASQSNAPELICGAIRKCSCTITKSWSELLILCIGTDRITGDCLGPITGQLLHARTPKAVQIYGTLNEPVHACNLAGTMAQIQKRHPSPLILAIDASLGSKKHLGCASIGNGALLPGAGVHKNLPPVGDLHITGVVNLSGFQEYLALQSTRLSTVIALSDTIARGVLLALPSLLGQNL